MIVETKFFNGPFKDHYTKKAEIQMSVALDKAHAQRQAMRAAGVLPNKTVRFSGKDTVAVGDKTYTETELLKEGARRAGFAGMVKYARAVVLKQAAVDAQRPVKERSTKSVEQLQADEAKLKARIAKLQAAISSAA